MKAFVVVCAIIASVAGDVSIQQPNLYLQPPVEHLPSKHFNAPWVEESAWKPSSNPHVPIYVNQQSSYYTQVQHDNNHQAYEQEQQRYQSHQQNDYSQHNSFYDSAKHPQPEGQYQSNNAPSTVAVQVHQQNEIPQHNVNYAPAKHLQPQGHYQSNVQITHPDWAMSYSNVNRYNTFWPAAPVMIAQVPFMAAVAAPAPFAKPVQAPVAVYNNNVAKWNPWNNNRQHSHDIAQVPHSVAKYVAITPGSIHIAPLPGHTVSHKILNWAPAGTW